jgi:hypothetical protein
MNERFSYNRKLAAASRPRGRDFPQRIRITHISGSVLDDSKGSDRKRIFAIVSRPIPMKVEGKTMRRILIFDNHPDSLRLVSGLGVRPDVDSARPRYTSHSHVILGLVVVMALVLAMIWPLL